MGKNLFLIKQKYLLPDEKKLIFHIKVDTRQLCKSQWNSPLMWILFPVSAAWIYDELFTFKLYTGLLLQLLCTFYGERFFLLFCFFNMTTENNKMIL